MGLSFDELDQPLDDIAFLARSNNRITVLRQLADEDLTRQELREATSISQPTLGRILDGFLERGWIANSSREYCITALGGLLVEEFSDLMDTVETIQTLRDLAPKLPLAEMNFDLRLLADGTITTPSPTDAMAHARREGQLLEVTECVRFLCNQAQPETVEKYRDWAIEGERELEAIISGDAIDVASTDPSMGPLIRDLVAAEHVIIYRYDGPVSVMLGCFEDTASIVPLDDSGVPCAFIESENETVRAWVTETLESYREQAEPVTLDSLVV